MGDASSSGYTEGERLMMLEPFGKQDCRRVHGRFVHFVICKRISDCSARVVQQVE